MSLPYFQQIERADHAIGQLLHFLEESCLDDEYTCLITSDHGGHGNKQSSRPGESHPQALTEPDVNVSAHPAPIVQPFN